MHPEADGPPNRGGGDPLAEVGPHWVEWIADNRLQGCPAETVVATLVREGIRPELARAALAAVEREPCFRSAQKQGQLRRKLCERPRCRKLPFRGGDTGSRWRHSSSRPGRSGS
jgi:hypothetical protein